MSRSNPSLDIFVLGTLEQVQSLLATNPGALNESDDDSRTPLHMAAEFCRVDIAKFLIDHGADVDTRTLELQLAPLHMAVRTGSLELVEMLLEHGADINIRNKIDLCPIHLAISKYNVDMIKLLLSKGADPNVVTRDRRIETPLLKASTVSFELTQLLIKNGARLSRGLKEILVSLLANQPDIANYLLELAIKRSDEHWYKLQPNSIGKSHLQALCSHVTNCDPNLALQIMDKLIKLGGDINYCNHFGSLFHALIARTENDEVARALFNKLVSFDDTNCDQVYNSFGRELSPVTSAIENGQFYFANQLLVKGFADVGTVDLTNFKFTPQSVDTLKLLYLNGFKFPDSFHVTCRPSNDDHDLHFAEFCSWLDNESNQVTSLKNLIRICLRQKYGRKLFNIVDHLPYLIAKFLLFK